MKALLAARKPLILLGFHKSFNDTRTNPSVPMGTRIFYLAKSRYEHLNHDRQICFTGESEEGYLLSEKIRDKKIFTRMKKLHI